MQIFQIVMQKLIHHLEECMEENSNICDIYSEHNKFQIFRVHGHLFYFLNK